MNITEELYITMLKFRDVKYIYKCLDSMSVGRMIVCGAVIEYEEENNDVIQVKDLSQKLQISGPALNKIINKLEDDQMIVRIQNKIDRRLVYLKSTDKAHEVYQQEKRKVMDVMNKISDKLGSKTEELIELLNETYEIVKDGVAKCSN